MGGSMVWAASSEHPGSTRSLIWPCSMIFKQKQPSYRINMLAKMNMQPKAKPCSIAEQPVENVDRCKLQPDARYSVTQKQPEVNSPLKIPVEIPFPESLKKIESPADKEVLSDGGSDRPWIHVSLDCEADPLTSPHIISDKIKEFAFRLVMLEI